MICESVRGDDIDNLAVSAQKYIAFTLARREFPIIFPAASSVPAPVVVISPLNLMFLSQTGDVFLSSSGQTVESYQLVGECRARGDYVDLPYNLLTANRSREAGQDLGAALLRLMYGVWEPASAQQSWCWGQSASEVIRSHPDFVLTPSLSSINFTSPTMTVTRYSPPSYVIVLENSEMMGSQWDLVRTVLRNLVQEYLPDNARLASSCSTPPPTPPTPWSTCLRPTGSPSPFPSGPSTISPPAPPGLSKAVETLHWAPAVILLISRAGPSQTETWSLATKHQLRTFSLLILPLSQTRQ